MKHDEKCEEKGCQDVGGSNGKALPINPIGPNPLHGDLGDNSGGTVL